MIVPTAPVGAIKTQGKHAEGSIHIRSCTLFWHLHGAKKETTRVFPTLKPEEPKKEGPQTPPESFVCQSGLGLHFGQPVQQRLMEGLGILHLRRMAKIRKLYQFDMRDHLCRCLTQFVIMSKCGLDRR